MHRRLGYYDWLPDHTSLLHSDLMASTLDYALYVRILFLGLVAYPTLLGLYSGHGNLITCTMNNRSLLTLLRCASGETIRMPVGNDSSGFRPTVTDQVVENNDRC